MSHGIMEGLFSGCRIKSADFKIEFHSVNSWLWMRLSSFWLLMVSYCINSLFILYSFSIGLFDIFLSVCTSSLCILVMYSKYFLSWHNLSLVINLFTYPYLKLCHQIGIFFFLAFGFSVLSKNAFYLMTLYICSLLFSSKYFVDFLLKSDL